MASRNDLYAVLGVSRSASAEEIKKVYRQLARAYHPDVNKGDKELEDRFKEISAAFDVLGDPDKRRLYDEFGAASLRSNFNPERTRAYRQARSTSGAKRTRRAAASKASTTSRASSTSGSSTSRSSRSTTSKASGTPRTSRSSASTGGSRGGARASVNPEDLFRRPKPPRTRGPGRTVESTLDVTLREAVSGAERIITVNRPKTCATCKGTGNRPRTRTTRCKYCKGRGRVSRTTPGKRSIVDCPMCLGVGTIPRPACLDCKGEGEVFDPTRLRIRIPRGVENGRRIRVTGQGGLGFAGGPPGDLILTVKLAVPSHMRRDGADLYVDLPVTVAEAMEGADIPVPTFEGRVSLRLPPGSQSGHKLRLKGKGLPDAASGKRGDLYFVVQIRLPVKTTPAARKAAGTFEGMYDGDLRADLAW